MKALLNVGGGNKAIPISPHFSGWRHDLLDIDPRGNPDIVRDARDLLSLPPATYDAIYCSHNLEHYHRHEGAKVVRGFHHLLRPDGFAEVHVPDLAALFQAVVERKLDIDDQLYVSPAGPILVRDVIYGYHVEIERSGQDFFGHKTGFTPKSLVRFMAENGFPTYAVGSRNSLEISGYFFKQAPTPEQVQLLSLPVK